jgi:hypothetical protein
MARKRRHSDAEPYSPSKRQHYELAASEKLTALVDRPQRLTPEEIGALFSELRRQLRGFAFDHFTFSLGEELREKWPLEALDDSYYALKRVTRYIADGSGYGWRHFFTTPESRGSLVYGIIGEYLAHYVFKDPSFGFDGAAAQAILDVDAEYLHYDPFVRARHRARKMRRALQTTPWADTREDAAGKLAKQLLETITPLLPTKIFGYDAGKKTFELNKTSQAEVALERLQRKLTGLFERAISLHWSTRLTGQDGSDVRVHKTQERNKSWFENAAMDCVNPLMMKQTQHHGDIYGDHNLDIAATLDFQREDVAEDWVEAQENRTRPVVKMICFPRVEMFVPHGPDQEQLGLLEQEYRAEVLDYRTKRDGSDGDDDASSEHSQDSEIDGPSSFDWEDVRQWALARSPNKTNADQAQAHIWPRAPDFVQHEWEERNGPWLDENGPMRLPWVEHYRALSNNDVYLEHRLLVPTLEKYIQEQRSVWEEERRTPSRLNKADSDSSMSSDPSASSSGDDEDSASSMDDMEWTPKVEARAIKNYHREIQGIKQHLEASSAKTQWLYSLPVFFDSERQTLDQAIASARAAKVESSAAVRVRYAAHSAALRSWNLVAANASLFEWAGALAFAALASVYGRRIAAKTMAILHDTDILGELARVTTHLNEVSAELLAQVKALGAKLPAWSDLKNMTTATTAATAAAIEAGQGQGQHSSSSTVAKAKKMYTVTKLSISEAADLAGYGVGGRHARGERPGPPLA